MHGYLMVTTFMSSSSKFSNGTLLAIANFVGLGLYIFVISKVAIELYDAVPLSWMTNRESNLGATWLVVEVAAF